MPTRQLPDPRQEAQAQALMETLRCLVCQGQSIADSDAEMAGDMRAPGPHAHRRRARRPRQMRDWLIARYGDWVSLRAAVRPADLAALGCCRSCSSPFGLFLARGRFKAAEQLMGWVTILILRAACCSRACGVSCE